jgi:undecaprenyl pyrophosphate phosphatase UppP
LNGLVVVVVVVVVVVGLHFLDHVRDLVWGDRVVVIEMVIEGCLFVNVKPR